MFEIFWVPHMLPANKSTSQSQLSELTVWFQTGSQSILTGLCQLAGGPHSEGSKNFQTSCQILIYFQSIVQYRIATQFKYYTIPQNTDNRVTVEVKHVKYCT